MCQSRATDTQMFLKCHILQVTVTFQEHLLLTWSLILALSDQRIFPEMLNTCFTVAEEAASAKCFLAGLESASKWATWQLSQMTGGGGDCLQWLFLEGEK